MIVVVVEFGAGSLAVDDRSAGGCLESAGKEHTGPTTTRATTEE